MSCISYPLITFPMKLYEEEKSLAKATQTFSAKDSFQAYVARKEKEKKQQNASHAPEQPTSHAPVKRKALQANNPIHQKKPKTGETPVSKRKRENSNNESPAAKVARSRQYPAKKTDTRHNAPTTRTQIGSNAKTKAKDKSTKTKPKSKTKCKRNTKSKTKSRAQSPAHTHKPSKKKKTTTVPTLPNRNTLLNYVLKSKKDPATAGVLN